VQRQRIGRGTVATVAQQDDYMKRIRYNGGSRSSLQLEGIIILGQYKGHSAIAEQLGVPVPSKGESVSCRVFPARIDHGVFVDGGWWRLALAQDPASLAPKLPIP
jgi:Restriction endonuclease NaeI